MDTELLSLLSGVFSGVLVCLLLMFVVFKNSVFRVISALWTLSAALIFATTLIRCNYYREQLWVFILFAISCIAFTVWAMWYSGKTVLNALRRASENLKQLGEGNLRAHFDDPPPSLRTQRSS